MLPGSKKKCSNQIKYFNWKLQVEKTFFEVGNFALELSDILGI